MLTASDLKSIQKLIQKETKPIKKELKEVGKNVKSIEKKLDITVEFFDKENLKLIKRVDRVEDQLKLPPLS